MEKGKTLSVDFVGKITRPFFIYSLPARFLFHTGWNIDKYVYVEREVGDWSVGQVLNFTRIDAVSQILDYWQNSLSDNSL